MASEIQALHVSIENLRHILSDKTGQVDFMELEASKYEQIGQLLSCICTDFVKSTKSQMPLEDINRKTPAELIQTIKLSLQSVIEKHQRLSRTYEVELSKSTFALEQKKAAALKILKSESDLSMSKANDLRQHQLLASLTHRDKAAAQQTFLEKKDLLMSHIQRGEQSISRLDETLQKVSEQSANLRQMIEQRTEEMAKEQKAITLKVEFETTEMNQKKDLAEERTSLKARLLKASYEKDCCSSELDKAKEELSKVVYMVESFRGNSIAKERISLEGKHQRLGTVLNTEKEETEKAEKKQIERSEYLEAEIHRREASVADLGTQIQHTEQKIQTAMMRIPDTAQLHAALDKALSQVGEYKKRVLMRKYMLDEIRVKNRLVEESEIQDSKARMAQLKLVMPIQNGLEGFRTSKTIEEQTKERMKELDEALQELGVKE